MGAIKLIIFDLDDTLIDTSGCSMPIKLKDALTAMINAGLKINSFEEALQMLLSINSTAANGKEVLRLFLRRVGCSEMSLLDVGTQAYYGSVEGIKINPLPLALELLEELNGRFDLALISMGDEVEQSVKLSSAGISPALFKSVIFTQEYDKGHHYDMLCTALGLDYSSVLVCGDKFRTDILPAQELGMKTVWMKYGRGANEKVFNGKPDFTITSLAQLRDVIQELNRENVEEGA